jgi:pSer/pThr/pTyr-binding forkhead associated (FHA) protein
MPGAFLSDVSDASRLWVLPTEEDGEFMIGREPPAVLMHEAAPISRRHALIRLREDRHWISDLGSRNGTFVNGNPINNEPVRLIDGDEIVLGGALALRFHDPTQTVKGERVGRLTGIWINERSGDVYIDGLRVDPPLSAAQMTLLTLLYKASSAVVTREEIVRGVWPSDEPQGISEEAIDGLIKRLRARLRGVRPEVDYIELVRGRGVRLKTNDDGKAVEAPPC